MAWKTTTTKYADSPSFRRLQMQESLWVMWRWWQLRIFVGRVRIYVRDRSRFWSISSTKRFKTTEKYKKAGPFYKDFSELKRSSFFGNTCRKKGCWIDSWPSGFFFFTFELVCCCCMINSFGCQGPIFVHLNRVLWFFLFLFEENCFEN